MLRCWNMTGRSILGLILGRTLISERKNFDFLPFTNRNRFHDLTNEFVDFFQHRIIMFSYLKNLTFWPYPTAILCDDTKSRVNGLVCNPMLGSLLNLEPVSVYRMFLTHFLPMGYSYFCLIYFRQIIRRRLKCRPSGVQSFGGFTNQQIVSIDRLNIGSIRILNFQFYKDVVN